MVNKIGSLLGYANETFSASCNMEPEISLGEYIKS